MSSSAPRSRTNRMTGGQRREQLLAVGRSLFAVKGFEGTSVEEIAAKAGVSKPIVYEHFGGKEGLHAVVLDREIQSLLHVLEAALEDPRKHPRELVERAALAFLTYIDEREDGFRVLVRESPSAHGSGTYSALLVDVASQVEHLMQRQLGLHGYPTRFAAMYSHMLVGVVSYTGQWWLDSKTHSKEEVASHIVNLAWNGLRNLQPHPSLLASSTPLTAHRRSHDTGSPMP